MSAPRVSLAIGFGAAVAAGLMLTGRTPGGVLAVLALVVGARAAAVAGSSKPMAARAFGRQVSLVPAWVGIALTASMRAGSTQIEGVRGANAVLGLALTHGSLMLVVACALALVSGAVAVVGGSPDGGWDLGSIDGRLEAAGVLLQVLLLVSFFAGPQMRDASDLIPWTAAGVAVLAVVVAARRFGRWDRVVVVATGVSSIAALLATFGPRP